MEGTSHPTSGTADTSQTVFRLVLSVSSVASNERMNTRRFSLLDASFVVVSLIEAGRPRSFL